MTHIKHACVLVVAALHIGCSEDVPRAGNTPEESHKAINHLADIAILVESGRDTDPHSLPLDGALGADPSHVELQLRDAAGRRTLGLAELGSGEKLPIPSFHPESLNDAAVLDVYLDDHIYGSIDIYFTAALPEIPDEMRSVVLDAGTRSMLFDMRVRPRGESQQDLTPCGNGTAGPGISNFESSQPGSSGQRFSFLPEWGGALFWAIHGELATDGIYRASWGCGTALKIPNNCTVVVSSTASLSYCCQFPYFTPTWVNTYSDSYWPDCPLL
jgi:hypothetical protein